MRGERFLDALFSMKTLWTLVSVAAGAVGMMWIQWAITVPHGLPIVPAGSTWLVAMASAWIAESRDREARRKAVRLPWRYRGIESGMHMWAPDHPVVAAGLVSARLAVIMPATPAEDADDEPPAEPSDVVVRTVR